VDEGDAGSSTAAAGRPSINSAPSPPGGRGRRRGRARRSEVVQALAAALQEPGHGLSGRCGASNWTGTRPRGASPPRPHRPRYSREAGSPVEALEPRQRFVQVADGQSHVVQVEQQHAPPSSRGARLPGPAGRVGASAPPVAPPPVAWPDTDRSSWVPSSAPWPAPPRPLRRAFAPAGVQLAEWPSPPPGASRTRPGRVDEVYFGHVIQAGRADHRPPGGGARRHPHVGAATTSTRSASPA